MPSLTSINLNFENYNGILFLFFFLGFEQSPFKLTPEFVEVMGGTNTEHWREFNRLLLVGMMTARKHMDRIINFVEIMRSSKYICVYGNC